MISAPLNIDSEVLSRWYEVNGILFLVITNFVSVLILSIFLQGQVWALGVIIIAKGDIKTKLITEILGAIVFLACSLILYKWLGLIGAALGFLFSRIFNMIMMLLFMIRNQPTRPLTRRCRHKFVLVRRAGPGDITSPQ